MRIAALALVLPALAGSTASGRGARACPGLRTLGSVTFVRAGQLHEVSLADCVDRIVGKAPGPQPSARVPGVRVRGHALWLTRGGRNVRLTRPLPEDEWPAPVALSPDGRYVLWVQTIRSASISADGLPLKITRLAPGGATHTLARTALAYPDYRSWCGASLAFVSGGDRIATHAKRLVVAGPPGWTPKRLWNDRTRSFGSVACASGGRTLATLSQRSSANARFFSTRWQLWRVGLDGSRRLLDRPPAGFADESPRWSPDGGSLLFVRERQGHGSLMVWHAGRAYGSIASLGYSIGFYGHRDWPIAWRR